MTSPDHLAERYGTASRGRRYLVLGACAAVVVTFLGWLAWTTVVHATPDVGSQLVSFDVLDEHTVTAVVQVELSDDLAEELRDGGSAASCTLRAFAEDHSTVGELRWTPGPASGREELTIRTERRATSVEGVGCTAQGQPRPR